MPRSPPVLSALAFGAARHVQPPCARVGHAGPGARRRRRQPAVRAGLSRRLGGRSAMPTALAFDADDHVWQGTFACPPATGSTRRR